MAEILDSLCAPAVDILGDTLGEGLACGLFLGVTVLILSAIGLVVYVKVAGGTLPFGVSSSPSKRKHRHAGGRGGGGGGGKRQTSKTGSTPSPSESIEKIHYK